MNIMQTPRSGFVANLVNVCDKDIGNIQYNSFVKQLIIGILKCDLTSFGRGQQEMLLHQANRLLADASHQEYQRTE